MKKFLFFAAIAALSMTACNKSGSNSADNGAEAEEGTGARIAYVELDTLMSQYQLYKDYSELLNRKGNNIQKTLAKKQRTLEQHAAAMQKKYENNGFTTRDELERAQNNIQKEQNELAELADRLNQDFNDLRPWGME